MKRLNQYLEGRAAVVVDVVDLDIIRLGSKFEEFRE